VAIVIIINLNVRRILKLNAQVTDEEKEEFKTNTSDRVGPQKRVELLSFQQNQGKSAFLFNSSKQINYVGCVPLQRVRICNLLPWKRYR